jgi:hypothetical protein
MDPFKWEIVKDRNGKTKVRIIEELEDNNNIPDEEIMADEETLSIENKKPLVNLDKHNNCYRELMTFEERKANIEKYFKNNFDWWFEGNLKIQTIYERNEKKRLYYIEEKRDMDFFEKYKETIYFTKSSMGKIHVQVTDYCHINDYKYLLKEDPEWEAKRISYWGEKVGAVFIRKIITNEDILQMKIDSFKIVKGFPEFCWKYCMLTPRNTKILRISIVENTKQELIFVKLLSQLYHLMNMVEEVKLITEPLLQGTKNLI